MAANDKGEDGQLRSRFRGVLLGAAVGDCLGRSVEGHRQVPESYLIEVVESPPQLFYTDDTAMMLAVAESLIACDGFSGSDLAARFVAEYQASPYRGYGAGAVTVFDRISRGMHWEEAAHRQFGGQGSYGNGGAMRVAPTALWGYPEFDRTAALAADTARVTHTHPVGIEGAVVQAISVLHALTTPIGINNAAELLQRLEAAVRTTEFTSKLEVLGQAVEQLDDDWAVLHLGHGVKADRSVPIAIYCFLRSNSFEETVLRALRMAGDTDTIAAMAGAIAGARFGVDAIPTQWQDVEEARRVLAAADAMWKRTAS